MDDKESLNMIQLKTLENIFAINLRSPVFVQLADLYYSKRQYDYAYKVCEIGMKKDPANQLGKYILSKIYLIQNKIEKAEILLKEIIMENPCHLLAFLLLVPVMENLGRSKVSIELYIKNIIMFYPKHSIILNYYQQYCKLVKNKPIRSKKKASKVQEQKPFTFHIKLATKTMYKLFIQQKKHLEAYELLKIMQKNKKNLSFVKMEIPKILKKIEKN